MKHNFLDLMGGNGKKPSRWALPIFLGIGLLLGAALAAAVIFWLVPFIISQRAPAPVAETPVPEDNRPSVVITAFDEVKEPMFLTVDWKAEPRELPKSEIRTLLRTPIENAPGALQEFDIVFDDVVESGAEEDWIEYDFKAVWEAGRVTSGKFEGGTVYHVRLSRQEMGEVYQPMYLIKTDKSWSLVAVGTFPLPSIPATFVPLFRGVQAYPNAIIEGIEAPEVLTVDSGKQLTKGFLPWDSGTYRFDIKEPLREAGKTKEGWTLYEYVNAEFEGRPSRSGCLMAFGPDSRMYLYESRIPIISVDSYPQIPDITWKPAYAAAKENGYENTTRTGCGGALGCAGIVEDSVLQKDGGVVQAGTAQDGGAILVPAKPAQNAVVQMIYDTWFVPDGEEKPSMEDFLKEYPVPLFYWKDALGRWVEHRSTATFGPVECGKPVIYLYPEQTTDVSVRLPSFIDVTVSDPTYPEKGWVVTAQPNGQLMSHADGKTYGSLYWEGTGVGYAPPTEGFVVKDGEVAKFLRDVLPKYGLNETEAREFMEFWLPEMKGAPYYRISFLTSAWSSAAPLYVSPRPQTNIRIFMDWKPMSAPISLPEPEIVTPERNGFTLVEWGGTLWK